MLKTGRREGCRIQKPTETADVCQESTNKLLPSQNKSISYSITEILSRKAVQF